MSQPLNHPPHIYEDDTWYMITSSTFDRKRLFQPLGYKGLIRSQLESLVREHKFQLTAWVILDNHYHILLKTSIGSQITPFLGRLHGRASFEINMRENKRGRQVWHNYWDTCLYSEKEYWTRFNYIHHNPVKHQYVKNLQDWEFSSYRYYLAHKGEHWLADTFEQYPIIDFTDPRDSF